MSRLLGALLTACALAACQAPAPPPAESHAEWVRGELTQLLDDQQPACGAVLVYSRRDRLDYRVECASGRVYRVRVTGDGRVRVTPEDPR